MASQPSLRPAEDLARICLVLPSKNEEDSIESVVQSARDAFASVPGVELVATILADDSQDRTREIAREIGCVIVPGGGTGLGAAMKQGFQKALEFRPDIIVTLDSDGQANLADIPAFLAPVLDSSADLVLASRFLGKARIHYGYPRLNRFGVLILAWILRRATGAKLTDSHGGIRAMRASVVEGLHLVGTHTYVQETIIDAARRGFRIRELPSTWLERKSGGSRVLRSIPRYVIHTLPAILIRTELHFWIFYGAALVFGATSVLELAGVFGERFQASCHFFFSMACIFFGFATEKLGRLAPGTYSQNIDPPRE